MNNEKIAIGVDITGLSKATQDLNNLKKDVENVGNVKISDEGFKGFKTQIREARLEAEKALQAFGAGSPQYRAALKGVNDLKNEFDDLNRNIQNSNPDKPFQVLVGAGNAATRSVQGVTALMNGLGVSSKSAQEQIAQLQNIMAFGDALNSLDDITDGFKDFGQQILQSTAFQKANNVVTSAASGIMGLFTKSVDTTSTSFKVLKGAIAATGIGLLVVGVTALIQNFEDLKNSGGIIGTIFTAIGDAVGFLIDGITNLGRAIGLIGEEDTNQADIAQQNAERVKSAKENIYENELKIAKATGKGVEQLEKQKRDEILKTLKAQEDSIKASLNNPVLRQVFGEQFLQDALTNIQNQIRDVQTEAKVAQINGQKDAAAAAKAAAAANKEANDRKREDNEKYLEDRKNLFKQFDSDLVESSKIYQKNIQENSLNSIKDEFTKKQVEIDRQKQLEIDSANDLFNKQQQSLKDGLRKGLITKAEYDNLDKKAKEELEIAKLAITDNYANKQNELLAKKREEDAEKAVKEVQDILKQSFEENKTAADANLEKVSLLNRLTGFETPEEARQKVKNVIEAAIEAENTAFELEMLNLGENQKAKELLMAQHESRLADIRKSSLDQEASIIEAQAQMDLEKVNRTKQTVDTLIGILQNFGVKGKAIAAAGIVADAASAIANIIINTKKENKLIDARAAFLSAAFPFGAAKFKAMALVDKAKNKVSAGINIAGVLAAKGSALAQLGGGSKGGGGSVPGGGGDAGGGGEAPFAAPQLFGIGGQQIKDISNLRDQKVIVTEQDITRVQNKVSQIRRATIQGG